MKATLNIRNLWIKQVIGFTDNLQAINFDDR